MHKNWTSLVVITVIFATCWNTAQTRFVANSEKFTSSEIDDSSSSSSSSFSSPPKESSPAPSFLERLEHSIKKRSVQGSSCRGIDSRVLWNKLDRVCGDCYNLYRKAIVAIGCRKGCFTSDYFTMCVGDLLLPTKEYDIYVSALSGVW
uniref:CHH3 preproprotein n=1 Tax=Chorismus antarcticus TaxID=442697 RepID=A0A1W5LU49_CHOAN|nr:CHH3 preproprotein [Chorismus antarcticus]